jgi:hypothetical protein
VAEIYVFGSNGQSNSGPYHDIASWLLNRLDLNLLTSTNRVSGAYAPTFQMPFNAPGYSGAVSLKGRAIRNISYLNFYNPIVTGYTSYPGTGRVLSLFGQTGAFNHTALAIWVEQMFVRGTHQVASVTRKSNGKTYAVKAVMEPVMDFTVDIGVSTSNFVLANSGLFNNDRLTLSSTGGLPGTLSDTLTYYVVNKTAAGFQLSLTMGGVPVTFTTNGTGTHSVNVLMPNYAGSRLEFDVVTDPWSDPIAQFDEEFTYAVKVTDTEVGEAEAQLNLNFGVLRKFTAKLTGLQLRNVATGEKRVIDTWDPATRKVTLVNLVGLAPQTWNITAGDTVVIEPQGDVAFDRYCEFLPWSMFESNLSENIVSKVNPYMPGFDYPGDFHAPAIYGTDQQTPTAVSGTGGLFLRTIYPNIAWHVGFLVRLSEFFGREIYCHSCDFGGTSATHVETEIGTPTLGWYDKSQQTDWSMGRQNGCFQRWLDELDALKAWADRNGHTVRYFAIGRNQGFADATGGSDPTYGATTEQAVASADKFYEVNKALRARMRAEIKARGFWPGDESEIPFIQPLEQEESALLINGVGNPELLKKVNTALQQLADEDPFAATWDQTGLLTGTDGIHFLGSELGKVEEFTFNAYRSILAVSDRTAEVEICNLALSHIGESAQVISIDPPDGSAQAALCALFYKRARNAVLEMHNWGFALRRRSLGAAISSGTSSYAYAYFRPGDAQRIISVLPPDAPGDYVYVDPQTWPNNCFATPRPPLGGVVTQPFDEGILEDGTKVILTNQPDAVVRYVANVKNTSTYPDLFIHAVAKYLASFLCGPLVKGQAGAALGQRLMQEARFAVLQAASLSAGQRKVEPDHNPSWMSARL